MGSSEDKETVNKFSLDERRRALRKFRKKAGLSQSDLGKMAGLSFSAISRFERGSRDLSPEAFARVSNAVAEVLSGKRLLQRERQEANRLNALRESREAKQLGVPLKTLLGFSGFKPDSLSYSVFD